ncbi:response regulator receiver [Halalkalibacter wakoensis JCM 9140]|uniref:Response regulator receiver n=1 Tax=Halalkalibacter wakoensis JCM 9140 TaxID=1236970 RepID=W4Q5I7_9BACI|nr:response regulator [Halalkalibacter wakoensis]GAE26624.1 response regulator receiver [Halalkalibacter wakoensis JCM 9140]
MGEVFQVLIVEDDFRVAEITRQFVEKVDGFRVIETVKTGEEALQSLHDSRRLPDLILLDVYIPDVQGLELFWKIRHDYRMIDVIMMTAAKEVTTIKEALSGGIFDYMVKPVDFSRFKQTLEQYYDQRMMTLTSKETMEQEEIDLLTRFSTERSPAATVELQHDLPKGIDRLTLNKIKNIMGNHREDGLTAVQVGIQIGASRSTARRYLEYLVSVKELLAEQKYGDVGRPERRYLVK